MNIAKRYEMVTLDKIVPSATNSKIHNKKQIAQIRASFREFGVLSPCLVDEEYNLLCGHGRVEAAREEGLKEINCVIAEGLTKAQKKGFIIADNKIGENATWDEEMLGLELSDLQDMDFDIDLLGFDAADLDKYMNGDEETQEDGFDVDAELNRPSFSKEGDVWKLGKHKVICGDSTELQTYKNLLGDEKVNLVCTDPPYMVQLESASGKIKNDDLNDKDAYEFLHKAFSCMHESMTKDASIYFFYATSKARIFHDAYEDAGFKVGAGLVWKKDRLVLTRTDWKYNHEPICWGWRKDGKHIWYGDQKQKTVFEFDRIKNSKEDGQGHPSSKPVPLIAYLIKQCTMTNSLVLDSFLGSASTLIACEQLGRVCFGVELEPKFVDVAVKRYIEQVGTSENVVLIRNGETLKYDEVVTADE